jgi:hypothetical protein
MLIPIQLTEAQLITKFYLDSYDYENEILSRFVLQAVTYRFNLGFLITSISD